MSDDLEWRRYCKKCNEWYEGDYCKPCESARRRARYTKDLEKSRAYRRAQWRKHYKIGKRNEYMRVYMQQYRAKKNKETSR